MKFVKIAGLCLASMLVLSMAITATASASPHWLVCSTGGTATKYTTANCGTASSSGTFQWNELAGTEAVKTKGSLLLKDTSALINSSVECYGESVGSVGPGKFGRVNEVKVEAVNCHRILGCANIEKVKAVDLPWQTELYETEGKILQALSETGNGEPGWEVECLEGSTKVKDVCKQEVGKPESILQENKATGSELLVLATFQHLRKAECSAGGAARGEVVGSLAAFNSGGGLRVSK